MAECATTGWLPATRVRKLRFQDLLRERSLMFIGDTPARASRWAACFGARGGARQRARLLWCEIPVRAFFSPRCGWRRRAAPTLIRSRSTWRAWRTTSTHARWTHQSCAPSSKPITAPCPCGRPRRGTSINSRSQRSFSIPGSTSPGRNSPPCVRRKSRPARGPIPPSASRRNTTSTRRAALPHGSPVFSSTCPSRPPASAAIVSRRRGS